MNGLEIIGRVGAKFFAWGVDSQGRGLVAASSESEDRHINQVSGKVWSVDVDGTTANAGAYFYYFHNSSTAILHITDVRSHCQDAASIIDIDAVTVGTIGNDTAITDAQKTSRHVSHSAPLAVTQAIATSATGLTGLTKTGNIFHAGSLDNKSSHLSTSSNVIIPVGAAVAIKVITANATNGIVATISFVEVSHE